MTLTRKQFVGGAAAGTVLLLFQGCGGGGSYAGSPAPAPAPMAAGTCGATGTAISDNHGHEFTIPTADLDSMVSKTYNIMGAADHNHTVTLSAAQLAQLKANQSVSVTSTTASSVYIAAHSHQVTITCA